MSDTTAVTLGKTAYVIGGYTTTTPLRSVLAFRPGRRVRDVAGLPHPVRYAAAAAIGSRIYVAGGTTGTQARREIVEVDPAAHRTRVVGRLPAPLAHAAGAALRGTFYILGGRGDALTGQHATIWAFDPATRRLRRAGRLPVALSDLSAVADGDRIVVVGGRDRRGGVHAERWSSSPRAPARGAPRLRAYRRCSIATTSTAPSGPVAWPVPRATSRRGSTSPTPSRRRSTSLTSGRAGSSATSPSAGCRSTSRRHGISRRCG